MNKPTEFRSFGSYFEDSKQYDHISSYYLRNTYYLSNKQSIIFVLLVFFYLQKSQTSDIWDRIVNLRKSAYLNHGDIEARFFSLWKLWSKIQTWLHLLQNNFNKTNFIHINLTATGLLFPCLWLCVNPRFERILCPI